MTLQQFKATLENLCWDDLMTVYSNRNEYSEEKQKIIREVHTQRCDAFNRYMCF